jgi:hypothetical protein
MEILDLLAHLLNLTADEAVLWIRAANAEADALRQHDLRLYPLTVDPEAMATAKSLHNAWQRWADDAKTLLNNLPVPALRDDSPDVRTLRLSIAYAHCLHALEPEELLRRHQQVENGKAKLWSIEEVRRELGLATQA